MSEKVINPGDFQVFTFEDGQKLRIIVEDGKPLFLANDVCKALGYGNPWDALSKHCNEKGLAKREVLTEGGNQLKNFIDEANVYRLIMRSKLPKAEEFQDWVCGVVLPSIRKTGKYEREDGKKPAQEKIYRINELREWLFHHGFNNSRPKSSPLIPSRILLKSMEAMGLVYKDVKNRNWVATHYAIENNFCVNVPVKRFVTFTRDGRVSKTNTRFAFAVTEAGANEYAHELVRLAKKYKVHTPVQTKLLQDPVK